MTMGKGLMLKYYDYCLEVFSKASTGDETSGNLFLTCASNDSCFCSQ